LPALGITVATIAITYIGYETSNIINNWDRYAESYDILQEQLFNNVLNKKKVKREERAEQKEKQKNGSPKPNDRQKDQFEDALKKIEKNRGGKKVTREERQDIHRQIHGQNYSYKELVEVGMAILDQSYKELN